MRFDDRHKLFALVMANLLSLPLMILWGSPWMWAVGLIVAGVECLNFTVTYHRLLAHKAFNAPKWFWYGGSLLGVLSTYGSPISAVANHRKHHRFSDTDKDPHNTPHGFWSKVYLRMFHEGVIEIMYAKDLLRSKFQVWIHKNFFKIHALAIIVLGLISWKLLVAAYAFPASISWFMSSIGSVITHWNIGTHPNDTGDKSVNHWFLQWFMFGEGLHNNHHAFPAEANFGVHGEADPGYWFIKLIDRKA